MMCYTNKIIIIIITSVRDKTAGVDNSAGDKRRAKNRGIGSGILKDVKA